MDKVYDPHTLEQRWYQAWEQHGYFKPQHSNQPNYCIMLPPPNVTGSLHMGHGFQHTLMDVLIRYHRMRGENVLWQAGVDHAGISTQMVVERQLLANENKNRHDLGRDDFLKRVWEWKEQSGDMICKQLRRMGSSIDWSRERFTMDPHFDEVVQDVFIKLHDEGLIYRGKKLVNWDPKLHTAISDLEVISNEEEGQMWYFRYPLVDGSDHIVIATTRPETMLGDVAVAVNPDDERYQHLIGKYLKLPLVGREIPIIADDYVDPTFGTGCVKITPAHDFNDNAIGQRHNLPLINIFTIDAKLNEDVPATYRGLDRFEARKRIVADLQAQNLVEKIEKHNLKVPRGDRTNEVIEPYLTDQWFVKIASLAKPAIEVVEKGLIEFVPENWSKTYFQWMHNIEDWCISRQLWWGHRIPAWYDNNDQCYVGHTEAEIRQKYKLSNDIKLRQDEDVLDTWFSSALWPFVTLGWPEQTPEYRAFYPTSTLITGFDIIFFWVARMIMMGLKLTDQIPFKQVYITGLVRDAEGHKMSKSKGNVLDPIDIIDGISLNDLLKKRTQGLMQPAMAEKIAKQTKEQFPKGIPPFGTDALRFTFCALATTGRDIRFDLGRVEGNRNFCNKLWNAARFVLMQTENQTIAHEEYRNSKQLADQWILSRLQEIIVQYQEYITHYRFDLLAQLLYEFTWGEFCDWYLELAKFTLTNPDIDEKTKAITRAVLLNALEILLRLLHPFMPFITEEIWQRIAPSLKINKPTIMLEAFPVTDKQLQNAKAEQEFTQVKDIIIAIRTLRSESQIGPGKSIPLQLKTTKTDERQLFDRHQNLITKFVKADKLTWLQDNDSTEGTATTIVGDLQIFIPLEGLIDVTAEKQRLQKEIEKLNKDLDKVQQKLANADYVAKAPAAIVEKEKIRCEELVKAKQKLETQLQSLK